MDLNTACRLAIKSHYAQKPILKKSGRRYGLVQVADTCRVHVGEHKTAILEASNGPVNFQYHTSYHSIYSVLP